MNVHPSPTVRMCRQSLHIDSSAYVCRRVNCEHVHCGSECLGLRVIWNRPTNLRIIVRHSCSRFHMMRRGNAPEKSDDETTLGIKCYSNDGSGLQVYEHLVVWRNLQVNFYLSICIYIFLLLFYVNLHFLHRIPTQDEALHMKTKILNYHYTWNTLITQRVESIPPAPPLH